MVARELPRCSLVSKVSRRTVALRSCNRSCSRRSRRASRFSRRSPRFREPTSPRSALIVSFCFRALSSALRSSALARGGEARAARFDLRRSAATFLRNATSSSFCSCERSSALLSRAFSRVSWRASLTSSIAALSLSRPLSSCVFSRPARQRAARSAWSNSSARASAASARARSVSARACACSYRDRQSHGSDAGAAMGGDQSPPSVSVSVRVAPKSSSRIVMCATIANRRRRYQCLVEGVENDVSPPHHPLTERFQRSFKG